MALTIKTLTWIHMRSSNSSKHTQRSVSTYKAVSVFNTVQECWMKVVTTLSQNWHSLVVCWQDVQLDSWTSQRLRELTMPWRQVCSLQNKFLSTMRTWSPKNFLSMKQKWEIHGSVRKWKNQEILKELLRRDYMLVLPMEVLSLTSPKEKSLGLLLTPNLTRLVLSQRASTSLSNIPSTMES